MRYAASLISALALSASCSSLPSSFDTTARPVVSFCDGDVGDGGVVAVGRVLHLAVRNGEGSLASVENAQVLGAADGGYCVAVDAPGLVSVCLTSGRCVALTVERETLGVVRAVVFGDVPVGRSSTQSSVVTNRLAEAVTVSATSDASEFAVVPSRFTIGPRASRTVTLSFAPSREGEARATLTLTDGSRDFGIDASGRGGGAMLVVQEFVDAGFITQTAARNTERRRLRLQNLSVAGSGEIFVPGSVPARASCREGQSPRLVVSPTGAIPPATTAFVDLLIEPVELGIDKACRAEIKLGTVWYPFDIAYKGIVVPPVLIGYASTFPSDGGLEIDFRHGFPEPAYLSWPRLEKPDAGLELVASWSEAVLPQGVSLKVFVRQNVPNPQLPNAVLVDGNLTGGRFDILSQ